MDVKKVRLVFYSPTGKGKKVASAIAEGTRLEYESIDLTPFEASMKTYDVAEDELAIIAAPVYGGRIPTTALERLEKVKGNNTPAVLVAMYGNREFEDALIELRNFTNIHGFKAIAGSAFIGQHSFDSEETPIATGRPDTEDLKTANEFGAEVMKKLGQIKEIQELIVPGNHPYKERRSRTIPISPEVDDEICTLCGICASVCPTSSITVSDLVVTEKPKCTACSACVQNCPTGAMQWKNDGVLNTAKWLSTEYCERKEPEIFL